MELFLVPVDSCKYGFLIDTSYNIMSLSASICICSNKSISTVDNNLCSCSYETFHDHSKSFKDLLICILIIDITIIYKKAIYSFIQKVRRQRIKDELLPSVRRDIDPFLFFPVFIDIKCQIFIFIIIITERFYRANVDIAINLMSLLLEILYILFVKILGIYHHRLIIRKILKIAIIA